MANQSHSKTATKKPHFFFLCMARKFAYKSRSSVQLNVLNNTFKLCTCLNGMEKKKATLTKIKNRSASTIIAVDNVVAVVLAVVFFSLFFAENYTCFKILNSILTLCTTSNCFTEYEIEKRRNKSLFESLYSIIGIWIAYIFIAVTSAALCWRWRQWPLCRIFKIRIKLEYSIPLLTQLESSILFTKY